MEAGIWTYQVKIAVDQVVGPRADQERIPGIDIALRDGETWMFGEQLMRVLDTPGHTRGNCHVIFISD